MLLLLLGFSCAILKEKLINGRKQKLRRIWLMEFARIAKHSPDNSNSTLIAAAGCLLAAADEYVVEQAKKQNTKTN